MITGLVTTELEARVSLFIEDGTGQSHAIDAVVDTGFSGFLSLPTTILANLGLTWLHDKPVVLGDGTVKLVDVYSAVVIWDSQPRTIQVNAIDTDPLVGMKMLAGHELRIRVVDGGLVWIDLVP